MKVHREVEIHPFQIHLNFDANDLSVLCIEKDPEGYNRHPNPIQHIPFDDEIIPLIRQLKKWVEQRIK